MRIVREVLALLAVLSALVGGWVLLGWAWGQVVRPGLWDLFWPHLIAGAVLIGLGTVAAVIWARGDQASAAKKPPQERDL